MKFTVTVTITATQTIEVESSSEEQAGIDALHQFDLSKADIDDCSTKVESN